MNSNNKQIIRHPIFLGSLVKEFADTATQSLYIAFILDLGLNVLNFQSIFSAIVSMVLLCVIKSTKCNIFCEKIFGVPIKKLAYKYFKRFMLFEGLMNAFVAVVSVITGNAWVAFITCLILTPYGKIQEYGVNELMANSYTKEDYDAINEFNSDYKGIIRLIALGIGLVVNYICTGAIAYAIMCTADVINNFFYIKAYKSVSVNSEPKDAAETDEDTDNEEDEEAATDAA